MNKLLLLIEAHNKGLLKEDINELLDLAIKEEVKK
jgi:hypothetical protein